VRQASRAGEERASAWTASNEHGVADQADGQAFDHQVLALLRPYADDPGRPWGPWWLKEAAADITSLGGISVLGLFALIVIVFLPTFVLSTIRSTQPSPSKELF
jgi:hypothetical protein